MAGEHGGYRQPAKPAPVSGPGPLSKRTDSGPAQKLRSLPDAGYGENAEYQQLQQGAPLAQTPGPSGRAVSPRLTPTAAAGGPGVTPLGAPTARPNEPVTAGAAAGPGPGPEALGLPSGGEQSYQSALTTLQQLAATSQNSEVRALLNQLQQRM